MVKFSEMSKEQRAELGRKGGLAAAKVKRPRREFCNRRHRLSDDNVYLITRTEWNREHTKQYTYNSYRCRQCHIDASRKRNQQYRRNKLSG